MQFDIFASEQEFTPPDAHIRYWPQWLNADDQQRFWRALENLKWEQSQIRIAGRSIPIPRLNTWYGDPGAGYGYSGIRLPINPWTDELAVVRDLSQNTSGHRFNSVLANWYRDGKDSVDWHADDEPELGPNPSIATVSFGGPRRFVLKHRTRLDIQPLEFNLAPGSLLVMSGPTQRHWQHKVPKTQKPVQPRISLTYRWVKLSDR